MMPCLVTAVYTVRKRPCTRSYTRVHGPYTAKNTAGVHSRVHDRVDGRVLGRVHGRVHGGVTAVYTYTRPVYETYSICSFLTNSCDYIRKQSKAPYCLSPEIYKIWSKTGSGIKIIY